MICGCTVDSSRPYWECKYQTLEYQTTVGLGSTVSVAVALYVTTAPAWTAVSFNCIGTVILGQVLLYPVLLL